MPVYKPKSVFSLQPYFSSPKFQPPLPFLTFQTRFQAPFSLKFEPFSHNSSSTHLFKPKMTRQKSIARKPSKTNKFENQFLGPKGSTSAKEAIVEDLHVHFPDFEGTNILACLVEAKLENFCRRDMPTIPHLVHWFYKHVAFGFVEQHSWSLGVCNNEGVETHRYTDKDFAHDFAYYMVSRKNQSEFFSDYNVSSFDCGLRREYNISTKEGLAIAQNGVHYRREVTDDMSSSSDTKYFNGDRKMLARIATKVLLPTLNKDNVLTHIHALVTEFLFRKEKFNLGRLMVLHMQQSFKNKRSTSVPYGGFITHLVRNVWQIDIPGPQEVIRQKAIRRLGYERQGSILVRSRLVQEWEVHTLSEEDQRVYSELKRVKEAQAAAAKGKKRAHVAEEHDDEEPLPHEFSSEGPSEGPSTGRDGYFHQRLDEIREAQREMALEQANIVVTQRAILEENRQIKESQGLIMRLLKKIGSKCGCSDVELNDP